MAVSFKHIIQTAVFYYWFYLFGIYINWITVFIPCKFRMNRVKTFGVNANLQEKSLSIIRLTMQVDDLSEKNGDLR